MQSIEFYDKGQQFSSKKDSINKYIRLNDHK